jgi:voltage-gated sodium channel
LILLLIIVNALFLWLETSNGVMSHYGDFIVKVLVYSQIIFVWEIFVRFYAFGPSNYREFFKEFWNKFDFTIVALSFLPDIGGYVTVIRILRVLRILRILSVSDRIRNYLERLKTTPRSIFIWWCIYGVIAYTISLFWYYLFGEISPEHWGDLGSAFQSVVFLSLFQDVSGIFWKILENSSFSLMFLIWFYLLEITFIIKLIQSDTVSSK